MHESSILKQYQADLDILTIAARSRGLSLADLLIIATRVVRLSAILSEYLSRYEKDDLLKPMTMLPSA